MIPDTPPPDTPIECSVTLQRFKFVTQTISPSYTLPLLRTMINITTPETIVLFNVKKTTPTTWWRRQNAAPLKFDPKPSEAAFGLFFFLGL